MTEPDVGADGTLTKIDMLWRALDMYTEKLHSDPEDSYLKGVQQGLAAAIWICDDHRWGSIEQIKLAARRRIEPQEPWKILGGVFARQMLACFREEGLDVDGCQVEWRTDHGDPKASRAEIRLIYPDGSHECRIRRDLHSAPQD